MARMPSPAPPAADAGFEALQLRQETFLANWWSPHLGQNQSPGIALVLPTAAPAAPGGLDLDRDREGDLWDFVASSVPARTNSTMPSPTGRLTSSFGDVGV
mmetsp:Transcript_2536/g.5838  ORF Transcript_2536/g.5838 Transcript_2536/m.5838 type:complete len:101 (-) Transcript_2536:321-623(-)